MTADSLTRLILAFFAQAPDEELTPSDMAIKWSRAPKTCALIALDLHDRGLISRYRVTTKKGGYQYVYTKAAQTAGVGV